MADDGYKVQVTVQAANRQIMLNVRGDDIGEVMQKIAAGFNQEMAEAIDGRIRAGVVIDEQQAAQNAQAQFQGGGQATATAAPQQQGGGQPPKGFGEPCPNCGTPKTTVLQGKWGPWAACPNGPHR